MVTSPLAGQRRGLGEGHLSLSSPPPGHVRKASLRWEANHGRPEAVLCVSTQTDLLCPEACDHNGHEVSEGAGVDVMAQKRRVIGHHVTNRTPFLSPGTFPLPSLPPLIDLFREDECFRIYLLPWCSFLISGLL